MANVRARQAAATGKERPKNDVCGEEKKSMSLPMVRGMSMDTDEETRSCGRSVVRGLSACLSVQWRRPVAYQSDGERETPLFGSCQFDQLLD